MLNSLIQKNFKFLNSQQYLLFLLIFHNLIIIFCMLNLFFFIINTIQLVYFEVLYTFIIFINLNLVTSIKILQLRPKDFKLLNHFNQSINKQHLARIKFEYAICYLFINFLLFNHIMFLLLVLLITFVSNFFIIYKILPNLNYFLLIFFLLLVSDPLFIILVILFFLNILMQPYFFSC